MKNVLLVIGLLSLMVSGAMAQVEKGDKEIQALGTLTFVEGASAMLMQGTYGVFVTPEIELGAGPTIMYFSAYGFSYTVVGGVFFGRYNFNVNTKRVPYLSAVWYQADFSPDYGDFTDYSYVQIFRHRIPCLRHVSQPWLFAGRRVGRHDDNGRSLRFLLGPDIPAIRHRGEVQ
jgi:hypothetical protein